MRIFLLSLVSAAALLPGRAFSGVDTAKAVPPGSDTLDRTRIHAEYGDGNFEEVIQSLEGYRALHQSFPASDSLFLAKHLGVVYASNPASREKGKYWLYRMLQLDPGADLVDMYVGESVDQTFEKVRQEFIVRRNYRGINDLKLARSVAEGEKPRDTVVIRDTVKVGAGRPENPPARKPADLRTGWTANLNLGVGLKLMDREQWGATRKQKEFRAAFDFRERRWPINIAVDALYSMSEENIYSRDDGTYLAYRQTSTELNAGVRKIFDRTLYTMRPILGGGFGFISTQIESFDFQKETLGVWAEGGVYWELERHFNIGAEALWSWAEFSYGMSQVTDAGGVHLEMILGYHW